jgi:shikimate dehydrogenase
MIKGSTQVLGIIGDPVAHSLSPMMHNAALKRLGLDYIYVPFPVTAKNLLRALEGMNVIGIQGFNVTIPHKEALLPYLQEISPEAEKIGAVNTVYRLSQGGWGGTNTDWLGFIHPLGLFSLQNQNATVLGSGGSARAVIAGCFKMGLQSVRVVGRSVERLEALRATWPSLELLTWSELEDNLPTTHLLVNTTPIGMKSSQGQELRSPLTLNQIQRLPAGAVVYDLIYTPRPTLLLQWAEIAGYRVIDGLEMLIQQGAAALSLWLGGAAVPVDVMRETLYQYLTQQ